MTREDIIVDTARSYLGTAFQHMGRTPKVSLDCAGLIICVARELDFVAKDFDVPPYSMTPDGKTMLRQCRQFMVVDHTGEIQPGMAVLVAPTKSPQHLGIVGQLPDSQLSLIHASNAARPPRVIETRLVFGKTNTLVEAYSLPRSK